MCRFNFLPWSGFWIIFFFHCLYLYLFLLYFVVNSISEFQKTLKKLSFLLKKEKNAITILDFFRSLYFKINNNNNYGTLKS